MEGVSAKYHAFTHYFTWGHRTASYYNANVDGKEVKDIAW